jgi:hypothetical protein
MMKTFAIALSATVLLTTGTTTTRLQASFINQFSATVTTK